MVMGFAFISIDTPTHGRDDGISLSLPDAEIWRIFRSEAASNGKGKIEMGAATSAVRIRHDLHTRLLEARSRTDEVFRIVRDEAMYDRPIHERHRLIFYLVHVDAVASTFLPPRPFRLPS